MANVASRLRVEDGSTLLNSQEMQTIEEVLKSFHILFTVFPDATSEFSVQRLPSLAEYLASGNQALAVILPILILLLDPTETPSNAVHSMVMTYILGYATSASLAFKEVTTKLDIREREVLEASVRNAVEGLSEKSTAPTAVKRQISLRTF